MIDTTEPKTRNQHWKGPASAASSEVGMIGRIDGLISQCIASDVGVW